MNLMPRWMRQMPYSDFLAPLYHILLLVAVLGLVGALAGEMVTLLFVLPFLLFVFALWRTYIDDGYRGR